jgi:hypothetical protein
MAAQTRPLALMCSPMLGDGGSHGSVNSELLGLISKEVDEVDRQIEKVLYTMAHASQKMTVTTDAVCQWEAR